MPPITCPGSSLVPWQTRTLADTHSDGSANKIRSPRFPSLAASRVDGLLMVWEVRVRRMNGHLITMTR